MKLLVASLAIGACLAGFPDGPNQQCHDDAGPPWQDDGAVAYYVGFPNRAVLSDNKCSSPVKEACEQKGTLAAHLDGPINCGGKGWFCRIVDEPGHRSPGHTGPANFPDSNFASCNQEDTEHDRDGHCHGSDVDSTYGWWVRDHWHRNYAGTLRCCCGWGEGLRGIVNRCDYRKPVAPAELDNCRDANEEHNVDMHPGCTRSDWMNYKEPPQDQCWEVKSFGSGPYDDAPCNGECFPDADDSGSGSGSGSGMDGSGSGFGSGWGSGGTDGTGSGFGSGWTSGSGSGFGSGDETDGSGSGFGSGWGSGGTDGSGSGFGSGWTSGSGSGNEVDEADEFLLFEDFNGQEEGEDSLTEMGWTIQDSGRTQGPSEWHIEQEEEENFPFVEQTSNIRTRERHSKLRKLGTELVFDATWTDVSFGARCRSRDNDMFGLAVRRSNDGKNQLRVSFDSQRRRSSRSNKGRQQFVRIVEFVDGNPTQLASGSFRYKKHMWYDIEVQAVAGSYVVYVDGEVVAQATSTSSSTASGGIALYSFANRGSAFANIRVKSIATPGPVPTPEYRPPLLTNEKKTLLASKSLATETSESSSSAASAIREDEMEERDWAYGIESSPQDDENHASLILIIGSSAGVLLVAVAATVLYKMKGAGGKKSPAAKEEAHQVGPADRRNPARDGEPVLKASV